MKWLERMHTAGVILFFLAFVLMAAMDAHICAMRLRLCFFLFFVSLLLIVPYDAANLMSKSKKDGYDVLFLRKWLFVEAAGWLFFAIMLFIIE